ncbi:MAG: putative pectin lyase [Paenibacillus sp.]|jgi:hypothetical protein|nr:putative pectin lyase [Paenibacillus sp.]
MQEVYRIIVDSFGNDNNPGTLEAPLATLEGARNAIRKLKRTTGLPKGGVEVCLRGGAYPLRETFQVDEQDSGTPEAPIVFRSYKDEEARIVGGIDLPADGFGPVTDAEVLKRLPVDGREHIVQFDLSALGVTDYGVIRQTGFGLPLAANDQTPPELFYNGNTMTIARYPNEGYVQIKQVVNPGGNPRENQGDVDKEAAEKLLSATFVYPDDRPASWKNTGDLWMYGYWYWDWADGNLRIANIDAANGQITTDAASYYSMRDGQRYYYYNVLEELDTPGEWYLDRAKGLLYFYPPGPINEGSMQLSLLSGPMVLMNGASHITFEQLTFEVSRGSGIQIIGGTKNVIGGCTLRKLAGFAVMLGETAAASSATGTLADGCASAGTNHGVVGCTISDTGIGGILLAGGDRVTLTPGGSYARNNDISRYSRLKLTYSAAVQLSGVGNIAAHNYIHDAPHVGILIYGNDHLIEYNEIENVLTETGDAGAIYMGRDWTEQGVVIRYNYIHKIHNDVSELHIGIYLDDMASGVQMYGNVIFDTDLAVMIGGGRNNRLDNNLFLNCNRSLQLDARSQPGEWAANHSLEGEVMHRRLLAMPYDKEPWLSKYPALQTLWADMPAWPKYNEVTRNVIYRTPRSWYHGGVTTDHEDTMWIAESAREYGIVADNWATNDELAFGDEANGDFTLRPESVVFTEIPGFKNIPFAEIGLQRDKYRR